jgi:hypothetical protein
MSESQSLVLRLAHHDHSRQQFLYLGSTSAGEDIRRQYCRASLRAATQTVLGAMATRPASHLRQCIAVNSDVKISNHTKHFSLLILMFIPGLRDAPCGETRRRYLEIKRLVFVKRFERLWTLLPYHFSPSLGRSYPYKYKSYNSADACAPRELVLIIMQRCKPTLYNTTFRFW